MDINKLRDNLSKLNKTNPFVNDAYLFKPKPEDGDIRIRILPYKYNQDDPFIQLRLHYNIGYVMRAIEDDPITQFATKLKGMYNQDRAYWEQGKQLEPKLRIFAPVLIRGHENEGVKFWGFGKTVYETIVKIILNPEFGDITDLNTGTDMIITVKKNEGKKYNDTFVQICRNSTPATTDSHVKQMIENMISIDDVFITPTKDQLEKQFKSFANGDLSFVPNMIMNPNTAQNNNSNISHTQQNQQTYSQSQNPPQSTVQSSQNTSIDNNKNIVNQTAKNVAQEIENDDFWNDLN